MREYGEVRFRFVGGDDAAKRYIGIARTQLGILKNFMRSQGLKQLSRRLFLSDGTLLVLSSIFGLDTIEIDVSAAAAAVGQITAGEVPQEAYQLAVDLNDLQGTSQIRFYSFDPAGSPFVGATWQQLADFLGIPVTIDPNGPVVALVAVAGKITRLIPGLDPDLARVDAARRATARGDFAAAELILRNMEYESSGSSSSTPLFDGALNCDEGFFVDASVYGSKPYLAKLTTAMGKYLFAFAHDPIPSPTTNLFPQIDFTQYNNTQYVGYNYASRQWSYQSGTDAHGNPIITVVNQLDYVNAGTALSHPQQALGITPFSIPIGTTITHNMAQVTTESDFPPSNPYQDIVQRMVVQRLHFRQDSYTVSAATDNGDGTWTIRAGHAVYSDSATNGPSNGYVLPGALWVKQRRTPSGWEVTETVLNPSASIMPFTLDGTPAIVVSPPSASAAASSLLKLDGSNFDFDVQTWSSGDVVGPWTNGNLDGIYQLIFNEPFGPYGSDTHAYYPVVHPTPVYDVGAGSTPQQLLSRKGKVFSLNLDGSFTITDNTQSPSTQQSIAAQPGLIPAKVEAIEHLQYSYPGAATYAAGLAAARVDVEMQAFVPTLVQLAASCPPSDFISFPVFDFSTGKYLYYQLNGTLADPVFQNSWLTAWFGMQVAYAFNASSAIKQQYLNMLLGLVTIVADGGLPHEAIFFSAATAPTGLI